MATNSNDGDGPVAVVAVHGLGDQQAGESVRKIADLLLRVRASGRQVYAEFKEVRLRIATHPVEAKRPQTEFGALGVGLRDLQQQSREPLQEGQEDQEDPAHEFMCSQLAGYTGSGNPYETVKLEGRRKNGPPVHLFELHWADLSRIREGLLGTLAAFYQLILHIPNLGWLAIDHALLEHPGCGRWQCYAKVHARAVRVFLILPIVMVLMPLTLLTLLAEALPATWLRVVAIGVPAVAALLLCGRAMYRTRQMRFGALRWVLLPLLALALPSGLLWLLLRSDWVTESQLVAIGWVLVAALPFHYMLGKYDKQQPGVQ